MAPGSAANAPCHDPAPALLPRPVAAVLCGDRGHPDDRGRRRAVPAARRDGQLASSTRRCRRRRPRATNLYETKREDAMVAARAVAGRRRARDARSTTRTRRQVRRRLDQLARRDRRRADRARGRRASGRFETGTPTGDRGRVRRSCRTRTRRPSGEITVSTTTAEDYAVEVRRLLEVQVARRPRRRGAGVDDPALRGRPAAGDAGRGRHGRRAPTTASTRFTAARAGRPGDDRGLFAPVIDDAEHARAIVVIVGSRSASSRWRSSSR